MSSKEIAWSTATGPIFPSKKHPDYSNNILKAQEFCTNIKKSLPSGIICYISRQNHLESFSLWIVFSPSREMNPEMYKVNGSPVASCISLHQDTWTFEKEIEKHFNLLVKYSNEYRCDNNNGPRTCLNAPKID